MTRELKEMAKGWIEMWRYDVNAPERDKYRWVSDFRFGVVQRDPEKAIDFILAILDEGLNMEQKSILAAGPLEEVLAWHSAKVIEKVETLARQHPEFANLLGGVWQNDMSDEVWRRVQKLQDHSGW